MGGLLHDHSLGMLLLAGRSGLRAAWRPYRQLRWVSGLPSLDQSQVLPSCGVEPFSETFAANKAAMDGLLSQLRAGRSAWLEGPPACWAGRGGQGGADGQSARAWLLLPLPLCGRGPLT